MSFGMCLMYDTCISSHLTTLFTTLVWMMVLSECITQGKVPVVVLLLESRRVRSKEKLGYENKQPSPFLEQ